MNDIGRNIGSHGPDAQGTDEPCNGERGKPSHLPGVKIVKITPYKRGKTGVQATVWVRFFNTLDLQFRVLNGPDGIFVMPPNGEYRSPDGRRRFFRRCLFVDEEFGYAVEQAVIEAYQDHVAATVADSS